MVVVTRAASEVSITIAAGDSDVGERQRRDNHGIVTRLVTNVCDVTCTYFVARTFRYCTINVGNHLMSSDVIVK